MSWNQGTIRVGAGETVNVDQFLEFTDSTPTDINYIGLGSCCGDGVDFIMLHGR